MQTAVTDSLSVEQIVEWKKQETRSLARGDALKVYEVLQGKGPQVPPCFPSLLA